ncbi:GNAT family N-acetyltransferase [Kribbella antibiotica]|uniref:GNAT family N-acetyltransferase n=1 Tax=Kribbella antibiotica TaxID=190195 RepID=A0A4V2YKM2_9ACTN|nr:GNAT family N-acetyltransferase [Kribbella antibiotica]TDD43237.1 GNAT family N-acetyltransferase [Kribbella antibiotica]
MKLRPLIPADYASVLTLNATAAAAGLVDPLGMDRLDWLRLIAAHAVVVEDDDKLTAFLLTFTPGSAYDGLEYGWFGSTYGDRFLFIDRIVVDPAHRRQGVASTVYRAIERSAQPFARVVTRVRSDLPDSPGHAFHTARGYTQVSTQRNPSGGTMALLAKELTA